jgi:membrane protein YdbS with pleckstrin-like domain
LLTLWRAEAVASLAIPALLLAVGLGLGVGLLAAAITLAAFAVASALLWVVVGRRFRSWGYAERADDLLVRRGVLVHRLSVVPYGRMQFVDVLAGPFERRLGLAGVHLHTAAAATDAHIPGLPEAEATRLRDRLAELGEARAAGL